jgi:hypothetical protein
MDKLDIIISVIIILLLIYSYYYYQTPKASLSVIPNSYLEPDPDQKIEINLAYNSLPNKTSFASLETIDAATRNNVTTFQDISSTGLSIDTISVAIINNSVNDFNIAGFSVFTLNPTDIYAQILLDAHQYGTTITTPYSRNQIDIKSGLEIRLIPENNATGFFLQRINIAYINGNISSSITVYLRAFGDNINMRGYTIKNLSNGIININFT